MDWLRRNWPDLAIGLALVGVIAGIVATLITGGSFFPTTTASTGMPPAASAPADLEPGTDPTSSPAADVADDPAPAPLGSVSVLTPDGQATEPDPVASPATVPADAPAAAPAVAPVANDVPAASQPNAAEPAASTPVATPPPAAVTTPAAAPAAAPAATPVAASTPLPAAAGDLEAPYRVSVGAFGNPDNAARLAATFRAADYPVFLGTQGALTIVLVGPYDGETEARQVADRIAAGDFGVQPVVYRFRPDAATPGASTPTPAPPPPRPRSRPLSRPPRPPRLRPPPRALRPPAPS